MHSTMYTHTNRQAYKHSQTNWHTQHTPRQAQTQTLTNTLNTTEHTQQARTQTLTNTLTHSTPQNSPTHSKHTHRHSQTHWHTQHHRDTHRQACTQTMCTHTTHMYSNTHCPVAQTLGANFQHQRTLNGHPFLRKCLNSLLTVLHKDLIVSYNVYNRVSEPFTCFERLRFMCWSG